MANNGWTPTTLGDEIELQTGFPFKSQHYTEDASGVRLLRGDNVIQGELRWDGVKRWPAALASQHSDYQLQGGDVVLAMDRPWIEAGLKYAAIGTHDLPALLVQRVARLRGGKNLDTRFLRYLVASAQFTNHILAVQTGTAVPHISAAQIKAFRFVRPPISEQRRIADILGTLDDKIELNRRMNETLEAMARALFKSWFVDFDPVHAKTGIRKQHPNWSNAQVSRAALPNMAREIADLFPDSFEESFLGAVPTTWRVGRLDDLLVLQRGFDLPASNRTPGPFPVFSAGGQHGSHSQAKVNGPGVVTGRSGVLGNVFFVHEDFWPLNTTLWVKEYRASCPIHAFHLLGTLAFEDFNAGSAVPTLNRNHIHSIPVVVPPFDIVKKFELGANPALSLQAENKVEIEALALVRDTLLPQMLSGKLR